MPQIKSHSPIPAPAAAISQAIATALLKSHSCPAPFSLPDSYQKSKSGLSWERAHRVRFPAPDKSGTVMYFCHPSPWEVGVRKSRVHGHPQQHRDHIVSSRSPERKFMCVSFDFCWYWGVNLGFCMCQASTLLLSYSPSPRPSLNK